MRHKRVNAPTRKSGARGRKRAQRTSSVAISHPSAKAGRFIAIAARAEPARRAGAGLVGGWSLLPLTVWVVAFFRDPAADGARPAPGLVISPADGRVLPVVEALPPPELGLSGGPRPRIAIFMNVFDVHVNRVPCNGTVMALAYRPGKFFNASFDKASADNERMSIGLRVEGPGGARGVGGGADCRA